MVHDEKANVRFFLRIKSPKITASRSVLRLTQPPVLSEAFFPRPMLSKHELAIYLLRRKKKITIHGILLPVPYMSLGRFAQTQGNFTFRIM
jgi:hypothetical protein